MTREELKKQCKSELVVLLGKYQKLEEETIDLYSKYSQKLIDEIFNEDLELQEQMSALGDKLEEFND